MGQYCVYKHTSPSGKVYIGITGKNPLYRWQNGKGYKNNVHFWNAICLYGWDSFTHEILSSMLSKEKAAQMERELIAKYKSNNPEYGYNITAGGETNILPERSLEKIRKANKGRVVSAETRMKMSTARKKLLSSHPELTATRKGYKMSEEHRAKMLRACHEKVIKPIMCVETGQIFSSLTEASRLKNVNLSSLSSALNGRQKSAGGHTWQFVEVVR